MDSSIAAFHFENYTDRVIKCDDGVYRWAFKKDKRLNYLMLKIMIGIFTAIGIIGGYFFSEIRQAYGFLFFAGSFGFGLLLYGLIRLIDKMDPYIRYDMDEKTIRLYPQGRGTGINYFSDVRKVSIFPGQSELRLHYGIGTVRIYIPTEDYLFVKDYLLSRIPREVQIREINENG